jgi:hypothetical protein
MRSMLVLIALVRCSLLRNLGAMVPLHFFTEPHITTDSLAAG